ncbi:hypothetical protein S40288_09964 [Stachybotrys chartarum IBT 40288]|nr:hypothetical protein S40288_09964 [Stachybotrys chartarum IBT 40288]
MPAAEIRQQVHSWLMGSHRLNEQYDESRARAKLLWIHGQPGFGKTILCASLVERLSSIIEGPIAYFFFSSDHKSRNDPYMAMRSWVFQLASHPDAFAAIHQTWEATQDHIAPRSTVVQLLYEVLQAIPEYTLIINGIDECTTLGDHAGSLARFLEDVNKAARSTTHILIISRDKVKIRRTLRNGRRYTFSEYKILPEDIRANTMAYSRDIVDKKLNKKTEEINKKQLEQAVNTTPTSLDHVYKRIWDRIARSEQDRDQAFALLRWAVFALRPLTISEITEAVLINENCEDLLLNDFPDAINDEFIDDQILHPCIPLLETQWVWQNLTSVQHIPFQAAFRGYAASSWHIHANSGIPLGADTETMERDEEEREDATNKINLPNPTYYAMRLDQTTMAIQQIQTHRWRAKKTDGGRPPFDRACFEGNTTIVKAMLEAGANITVQSIRGRTPIYSASLNDRIEVVKLLFQNRANIYTPNKYGWTPVNAATSSGHLKVVKILVKKGADIMVADNNGWTPLNAAASNGHLEVVKLLVKKGVDIIVANDDGWTPVNSAATNGHFEVVKILVKKGANIIVADNNSWILLNAATSNGHLEIIKLLVKKGADLIVANDDGWTPLSLAAYNGHLKMAKLLVENGADTIVANNNGWILVNSAARNGHLKVVKLLIEREANITVASSNGWMPVNLAARNGHLEVVKLLVQNGANVMMADDDGRTPVNSAASKGYLEVAKLLVENGADIIVSNNKGSTPMNSAASNGHLEVVKLLVEKGANIIVANNNG